MLGLLTFKLMMVIMMMMMTMMLMMAMMNNLYLSQRQRPLASTAVHYGDYDGDADDDYDDDDDDDDADDDDDDDEQLVSEPKATTLCILCSALC